MLFTQITKVKSVKQKGLNIIYQKGYIRIKWKWEKVSREINCRIDLQPE